MHNHVIIHSGDAMHKTPSIADTLAFKSTCVFNPDIHDVPASSDAMCLAFCHLSVQNTASILLNGSSTAAAMVYCSAMASKLSCCSENGKKAVPAAHEQLYNLLNTFMNTT